MRTSDDLDPTSDNERSALLDGTGDKRSFAGNAFWMLIAELVAKASSFALVVILARGLGREEYGYFVFAVSFVPLFLMLGTLGVDIAVVREVARDRARLSPLFASGLTIRAFFGVVALVVSAVIGIFFVESGQAFSALVIVGIALFLDEISRFLGTVFKAFERMRYHATVIMVNRIVSTALAAAVLAVGGSLTLMSLTYLLGSLGALLFAALLLRRNFPPIHLVDADRGLMKELLREGAPVGATSVLNMITFRVDVVLLKAIIGGAAGAVAVGMYGIAYRFFESFLFVVWTFTNVALPRMSRSAEPARAMPTFQLTLAIVLTFYVPLAVGAPFAAEWVVTTVFSERYEAATTAVIWLTAALVFYAIAYLARVSTIAVGRRRGITSVAVVSLLANVTMNLVLIPSQGFRGAAFATFATEVIEATLLLALFVGATKRSPLSRATAVPLAAGAVMFVALFASGAQGAAAVATGAGAYAVGLTAAALLIAPDTTKEAVSMITKRGSRNEVPTGSTT